MHPLRLIFFGFIRLLLRFLLGMHLRGREHLPASGPAIIVANHNSHLDTMVLMSLFPLKLLPQLRPVAAADYFLKNRFLSWFSSRLIGIIPIQRGAVGSGVDPLTPCYAALDRGEILILFPEGTRGEPEKISEFKKGIAFLAERYPQVPITPVFMHGLGKALPKGDGVLVPFCCAVLVDAPLHFESNRQAFMQALTKRFEQLSEILGE